MRFPNLVWAVDEGRFPQYEFATRVGMDVSRFSRCLRGRFDFTPAEKLRICKELGFPAEWLFARPTPPPRSNVANDHVALIM